jgi:hypothetical protein
VEFSLPWHEYGELMIQQAQVPLSQASSPAHLPGTPKRGRSSSLSSIDDLPSSPIENEEQEEEKGKEIVSRPGKRRAPATATEVAGARTRRSFRKSKKDEDDDTATEQSEAENSQQKSTITTRAKRKAPPVASNKPTHPRRSTRRK